MTPPVNRQLGRPRAAKHYQRSRWIGVRGLSRLVCRVWVNPLVCAGMGLAGCAGAFPQCIEAPPAPEVASSEYMLVESRSALQAGLAPKIDLNETPTYRQTLGGVKTAAIRLPDSCKRDTANQMTGASNHTDLIARTDCGSWLAELERAFVANGVRVISWDAIHQRARNGTESTYTAAKALGADVVIVFNSLEASPIKGGMVEGRSHFYYESDEWGRRGPAKPLPDPVRVQLRAYISKKTARLGATDDVIAFAVTLDATAVLTDTEESMWFYRYTKTQPLVTSQGMRFLFEKPPGDRWYPAAPRRAEEIEAVVEPSTAAMDVSESVVGPSAQDPYAHRRLELFRATAQHFVETFTQGAVQ